MREDRDRYRLVITPTARRQLTEKLPEAVAFAAHKFIVGPLLETLTDSVNGFTRPWRTGTAHVAAPTVSSIASPTKSAPSRSSTSPTVGTPTAATAETVVKARSVPVFSRGPRAGPGIIRGAALYAVRSQAATGRRSVRC